MPEPPRNGQRVDASHDPPAPGRVPQHYRSLVERVEERMRGKTSDEWTRILNDAGVPVSAVRFPVELFGDPQTEANGIFHTMQHPTAGAMTVLSPTGRR